MSGFYAPKRSCLRGPSPTLATIRQGIHSARPSHCQTDLPSVLLAVTELDPGWIAQPTFALARATTAANGRSPQLQWSAGHNHASTVQSLGWPQGYAKAAALKSTGTLRSC